MRRSGTGLRTIFQTAVALCLLSFGAVGQTTETETEEAPESLSLSLKEAQDYAVNNNLNVQNANLEITKAERQVWETTASGLPQISGTASYQYFAQLPVQVADQSAFTFPAPREFVIDPTTGERLYVQPDLENYDAPEGPIELEFGQSHNASIGLTVNQLIFSGEYIVGLRASRTYKSLSEQQLVKSEHEIRDGVANAYYLALVASENKRILEETLETSQETLDQVRKMQEAGFMEALDVDQIELSVTRLRTSIRSAERQIANATNLLKFQLGVELDTELELTDELDQLLADAPEQEVNVMDFQVENHTDFKLIRVNEQLQELNLKAEQAAYLPSLSGYFSWTRSGFNNEFGELFNQWYPGGTIVGLQLNVPIFNSGQRRARVQQARIELQQTQNQKALLEQNLRLQARTAADNYNTALDQLEDSEKSMEIAKRIYEQTLTKYNAGTETTSLDLTQTEQQYLQAQGDYIQATFALLDAKRALDKARDDY